MKIIQKKKKRTLKHSYSVADDSTKQEGGILGWISDRKKLLWKWFFILCGVGFLLVVGVFLYVAKDLPSSKNIGARKVVESTKIYDSTGDHILYEVHGEENRTVIPLDQIPLIAQEATIALEDQDFYHHFGIHIRSIFRAVFKDIIALNKEQGASTITQQFVKNSLLTNEQTFTRKFKEAILAVELELAYSKKEILEMYLNEIPYGSNAYGIEAASQTFFNKSARDLTLDEAALLAALPRGTYLYSPYGNHTDKLVARKNYALEQMVKLGYIKQEEADAAKNIDTLSKISRQKDVIAAPHFVMYILEQLQKSYGDDALQENGYKVYTSLNWDMQQKAEEAIQTGAEKNLRLNASNAALVSIEPETGKILAMVGSKDYFNKEIDGQVNVATRERQPGSSFKPFVYLAAFIKGYFPETILYDVPTDFDGGTGTYTPQNYNGAFNGPVPMKRALGGSLNIPAVKTLYLVGVNTALNLAKNLGITSINDPNHVGLSLVLGGGEVTLLDHTHAYSTIANKGIYKDLAPILKVENANGDTLFEWKDNDGKRVVDEKYISILDDVLSDNENRAWVFGANSPLAFPQKGKVAAKTGTTNEFRDAWTMGYSPHIATGVWVGNNDNTSMSNGADGSVVAAPIWRDFMDFALQKVPQDSFPTYDYQDGLKNIKTPLLNGEIVKEEDVRVCEIKNDVYCLASEFCSKKDDKKRTFVEPYSILRYVNKNDPLSGTLKDSKSDPAYKAWDKGVEEYYKNQDKTIPQAPPEDKCKEGDV